MSIHLVHPCCIVNHPSQILNLHTAPYFIQLHFFQYSCLWYIIYHLFNKACNLKKVLIFLRRYTNFTNKYICVQCYTRVTDSTPYVNYELLVLFMYRSTQVALKTHITCIICMYNIFVYSEYTFTVHQGFKVLFVCCVCCVCVHVHTCKNTIYTYEWMYVQIYLTNI